MGLLFIGIVLLILGACVAYFGRPREQLIYFAGIIIFVIGVLVIAWWALQNADSAEVDALIGGPLAAVLARRG